jgi:hypothetical protein
MEDTGQALVRLAHALGISIETLHVASQLNDATGLSLSENAELIQVFEQIESVKARRRIISYAQGEANRRFEPSAGRSGEKPLLRCSYPILLLGPRRVLPSTVSNGVELRQPVIRSGGGAVCQNRPNADIARNRQPADAVP